MWMDGSDVRTTQDEATEVNQCVDFYKSHTHLYTHKWCKSEEEMGIVDKIYLTLFLLT